MPISIASDFDSGNIDVVSAQTPEDIQLTIRPDERARFSQWFYFRVDMDAPSPVSMTILKANETSYVGGWKGYRAVCSYDQETWFRVDTEYDGENLIIRHAPTQATFYCAYFAPYPTTRYDAFTDPHKSGGVFAHDVLGETLDGKPFDYFAIGDGPLNLWVIARQHPGETMGSWWMEGFFDGLLDETSAASRSLQKNARIHIIPCMNLDGSRRGHLRTNAAGCDLNRAWRNTSKEMSPEVYLTRERMRETGVDFFLDVHGDEAIANNFLDSAKGIPSWDDRHERLFNRYSSLLLEETRDFQTKEGYPTPPPGKANLDIACNYVAETWDCLAMTLEMPFKDANVNPDAVYGWSPGRCAALARANLNVMAKIADLLR